MEFNKGEIVRHLSDKDNENLYTVVKTNAKTIHEYKLLGQPKFRKDNKLMVVKPVRDLDYPGEIIVKKKDFVVILSPKKFVVKHNFSNFGD